MAPDWWCALSDVLLCRDEEYRAIPSSDAVSQGCAECWGREEHVHGLSLHLCFCSQCLVHRRQTLPLLIQTKQMLRSQTFHSVLLLPVPWPSSRTML
jgi:hypothetical protein